MLCCTNQECLFPQIERLAILDTTGNSAACDADLAPQVDSRGMRNSLMANAAVHWAQPCWVATNLAAWFAAFDLSSPSTTSHATFIRPVTLAPID